MIRSLRARLIVAAIIFVTIALVLTWLSLTRLFSDFVANEYERELQAITDTIIANLGVQNGTLVLRREPTDARFEVAAGGRYWQVDGPSQFSARSRSLWEIEIAPKETVVSGSSLRIANGPADDQLVVFSQEATLESKGQEYKATVYAAADYMEYTTALSEFRWQLFGMLLLTGILLLLASALQIFVGLRPLINIRKSVNALRQGQVSHIDSTGPQEVRPLIAEINTLMADNQSAVERARARASDLAHGLKTPLTILGQISEALSAKGDKTHAKMMEQQVSTIRSRVDRQLALARAGNPSKSVIDTAANLERLIKATKPLADANNVTIESDMIAGLGVAADPTDFLEAVGNIIDNAARHARTKICLSTKKVGQTVRIEICDDGSGIAETEWSAALERGRRLDETGEGTGLGLSISAEIMNAHRGSILLGQSDMGGLKVTLDWPLAAKGK